MTQEPVHASDVSDGDATVESGHSHAEGVRRACKLKQIKWRREGGSAAERAGGGHAFEYFDGVRADAHQLLVHSARTSRHGVAVRYAGSCEERSETLLKATPYGQVDPCEVAGLPFELPYADFEFLSNNPKQNRRNRRRGVSPVASRDSLGFRHFSKCLEVGPRGKILLVFSATCPFTRNSFGETHLSRWSNTLDTHEGTTQHPPQRMRHLPEA